MDEPALSGVRGLEIGGGIAAGFAGRLLAGYGADVVRVESATSSLTSDEEIYLLPRKRRIRADTATLRSLALAADIIVEDGPPGALAALGLDPRSLRRERPALVIVSVSPFGQSGPHSHYQATNIVAFAMGGLLSLTGSPQREPLQNGGSQAEYLGGINAFSAAATAYYGALVQGEGDWVDISLQECAAGMLELYGPGSAYVGAGPQLRMGNHVRAVWAIYPCIDGYAGVCTLERQVPALFDLVGVHDERFRDPLQRAENDDELTAIMYGWFGARTKEEILACSPIHKIPFGAVLTPGELLASENLQSRGFFDSVTTPAGEARFPGRPFEGLVWDAGQISSPGEDTPSVTADWLGAGA
jgi:CoA:oxalate CoA-transferase